jgi:hypothetical protein
LNCEELIEKLADDPLARLRWRVCREFEILPCSREAKRMSDRDVVLCGAQLVLDRRELRGRAVEGEQNSSFDEERFAALSEDAE